jgi:hypothetical protein
VVVVLAGAAAMVVSRCTTLLAVCTQLTRTTLQLGFGVNP